MKNYRLTLRTSLFTLFIIGFCFSGFATVETQKYYVSRTGDDSYSGTIERPFATLRAAQMAVRNAQRTGLDKPVEVIIRGGVYYIDETLELNAEDSGTEDAPVTWRAAEDERVILSGGREIKGTWRRDSDGKTWYVDVPVTKGWVRDVNNPETYQKKPRGPWNFRQLFVEEKRATRARYPNSDEDNPFLYSLAGSSMEHIVLEKGKVKSIWGDAPDAQINIVPGWCFFNQWNDVVSVDVEKSEIYVGPRERHGNMIGERHGKLIDGNWFWIEGVRSELDVPGEWYLDNKAGRLYYMPEEGQNPNDLKFIAPYLNRLIYLKGDVEKGTHVEYVNFDGLEFRHTTFTLGQIEARVHTDGAIKFNNAQNCAVRNCLFENIGGYALWLHLDCKNNVFYRNTVLNSGGGGVLLTGSRLSYMDDTKIYTPGEAAAQVAPYLTSITHNTVKHCGQIRYYGGGVHIDSRPASMAMMPGNYIAHNHFQDLSRNGIFTFRNQGGNVIEFNEIHDCMQTTVDGAAIHFASMNRLNAPNFILNNYLYNIWGFEQKPDGNPIRIMGNGVFLDWATSNTTVKNNVVYNTAGETIKVLMGNWNLDIENNLVSETRIEPFLPHEIGPNGNARNFIPVWEKTITGGVLTSFDDEFVEYSGNWETTSVSGIRGLFEYNYKRAAPEQRASWTYKLPVTVSGTYKVTLMYFPRQENASNSKITVSHANGEETLEWNFKMGHFAGFSVLVGEYQFDKDQPATLTISNEGADGFIVADGVGIMKVD